jgi:tRNA (cytidine/uridine-2'-O-)-methyltransferase
MPNIVLVHPQIPPNTGNIARTCAATDTQLHLVAPLGFEISDRRLKRAGLDYWPYVDVHYHTDIEQFAASRLAVGGRTLGFSVRGARNYTEFAFREDDWLLFGSETSGLPPQILDKCDRTLYIPMSQKGVRSLNLANSVAIVLFEALRQLGCLQSLDADSL